MSQKVDFEKKLADDDKEFVCLISFLTFKSTIFQLCWDGSSWVEPVLSRDKCVLLKDTTQWWRGSNPRALSLESSTLPLGHCAPYDKV